MEEKRGFKKFLQDAGIFLIGASLFTGCMIASAGIVTFPNIAKISAPLVCPQQELEVVSQKFSYKPGQSGVTREFYCVDLAKLEKKPANLKVIVSTFVIFTLSSFVAYFLIWKLTKLLPKKRDPLDF